MISLKVILVVIGLFFLFAAGFWGYFGSANTNRPWFTFSPGWAGLFLLYLSQYVA